MQHRSSKSYERAPSFQPTLLALSALRAGTAYESNPIFIEMKPSWLSRPRPEKEFLGAHSGSMASHCRGRCGHYTPAFPLTIIARVVEDLGDGPPPNPQSCPRHEYHRQVPGVTGSSTSPPFQISLREYKFIGQQIFVTYETTSICRTVKLLAFEFCRVEIN